jgi:hypothetical protein
MAKSKDKKSGVPKTVAGVKIPKSVRKSSPLASLFNSSLGREILADALIAAAGAAAAALTRTRTAEKAGHAAVAAGTEATEGVQTAAGAVANVVTEAARSFLPPSLVGEDNTGPGRQRRYAHKTSDHSSRKRSKKGEKKGDGAKKRSKKDE